MPPTPALVALFNSIVENGAQYHVARLYTITLAGGGQIRFTDADFDIKGNSTSALVNGFTYPSGGIRVDQKESKTQAHLKVGTDTDTWTVVLMPRPFDLVTGAAFPDLIGSVPFLQAANAGALDAADFQVDEAYFAAIPTWPMPPAGVLPVGCKTIFAGTVGQVDTTNLIAVLTVNDYRSLLSISVPIHYYQAQCRHTLFDAGCQLVAANFALGGTVSAGSTQSTIIADSLPAPAQPSSGTYALGRVSFVTGLNAGFQRTIKSWDGAFTLQLLYPLPYAVSPGDVFDVFPGCDKQLTTCTAFANQVNFGGVPFVPPPETQGG